MADVSYDQACQRIADAVRQGATFLDLCGNRLTVLPLEIGGLTALQRLDLRHNQLTTLPPEIGKLTALRTLYLGSNLLTTLPPAIGALTALRTLGLGNNVIAISVGQSDVA